MTRTLLPTLALLPLVFACQPEFETSSAEVPVTVQNPHSPAAVEVKNGTADLQTQIYASIEVVETQREEYPWHVYVAADHYVSFWADSARTVPVTLGSYLYVNYASGLRYAHSNYVQTSNLSVNLQPGSHSYYLGNLTTEDCYYGANGNPENCYYSWMLLREGYGYTITY